MKVNNIGTLNNADEYIELKAKFEEILRLNDQYKKLENGIEHGEIVSLLNELNQIIN